MRLLLVTSVYPSPRRPVKGVFNQQLVSALRAAGDDVRVVVPIPWTDLLLTRPAAPPAPQTRYPVWWYPPRVAHQTHHRWMAHRVLPAIDAATSDWRPDVVVGYWTHPDGTVALQGAKRLAVPGVILAGGSDIHLLTRDPARRPVILETLHAANRVVTVGISLREAVIALGVDPAAIGAFTRGVDLTRFHPGPAHMARNALGLPADRPIALWVGRMVPVKGLDLLVEAWRTVTQHPARPLLCLVGDGAERRNLERRSAEYGDSIWFVGNVRHDQLADWYRAADVVVLPSRSEGIPNVLLEGLACGTPFIASDVGGVRSLASDPSVVVPPGDTAALARALEGWAEIPPMTRRSSAQVADASTAVEGLRRQFSELIALSDRPLEPVA
ncbi:MAG TPA: glycosyltransferase [Gemmatimonadales bacterium]|jgi:glycosyltransferase involved in cell wall biosynthesis